MIQPNNKKCRLSERDEKILAALWKWRLLSNAALTSKRFFPTTTPARAYNRLREMYHGGFIQRRGPDFPHPVELVAWTLSKKGYKRIRRFLPMRRPGYRGNDFLHDFLATACHIGDWLVERPKGVKRLSLQEIRKLDYSEFLEGIPQTSFHQPDGYWRIENEGRVSLIALEVESLPKRTGTYQPAIEFYTEQEDIDRVLWLVLKKSVATRLQRRVEQWTAARAKIHNFVLIDDFMTHAWRAKIFHGPDQGKTIGGFLGEQAREKGENVTRKPASELLLNGKRSYVRSELYPKVSTTPECQLTPTL